ncbi:flagellar protein [Anaerocolumna sedimenticola]|uniref:Flagellar protein n=1 Tax=Anaerocolumna sedimenticola TaxID=2696063 RepID=A0A6P1TJC1_9FIRM|nr:flagellar protein [Anaerocolumna sedimenticola]QHQ60016.1 flagellar protein [Anaerocolumna sedimenticola]
MDVRNCKSCGKLYNYISGQPPLCNACLKALDEKFSVVKEYIYNHPGAGIAEVAEENDVSTMQIQKWIREERLAFSPDSPIGIECENCGTMIKTGRFCKACKDKLVNNFGSLYKEEEEPQYKKKDFKDPNGKIRFLDRK